MSTMTSDAAADIEALERVRAICLSLSGVDEGELQDRPLFRVGRRRFAIFNGATSPPRPRWNASGRSLHFVASGPGHDALRGDARFGPSPHHGDRGWFVVQLGDLDVVDWDEVSELLECAYRVVAPRSVVER
jgi:hypothetical protein